MYHKAPVLRSISSLPVRLPQLIVSSFLNAKFTHRLHCFPLARIDQGHYLFISIRLRDRGPAKADAFSPCCRNSLSLSAMSLKPFFFGNTLSIEVIRLISGRFERFWGIL